MRRVAIDEGRRIEAFGSIDARVAHVARSEHAQVVVLRLGPGGRLGRHPAGVPQLLYVVEGAGWTSGADGERTPVQAGQAVLFDEGEEHETGTDEGLTAVVVEAEGLTERRER